VFYSRLCIGYNQKVEIEDLSDQEGDVMVQRVYHLFAVSERMAWQTSECPSGINPIRHGEGGNFKLVWVGHSELRPDQTLVDVITIPIGDTAEDLVTIIRSHADHKNIMEIKGRVVQGGCK